MPKSSCARKQFEANWTVGRALDEVVSLSKGTDRGFTFIQPDRSEKFYRFQDISSEAKRRANHLRGMGLGKGDKLALVIPDPEEFILTFIAATTVGIVPVPMYPPLGFGKLDSYVDTAQNILEASDATVLLTDSRVQAILWSLVDKVPTLERIMTIDKLEGPASTDFPEAKVEADDTVFLQFTSGSTALPKGVVVTHKTLAANLYSIMGPGLEMVPGKDVTVSWLPLYHDMGLIGMMLAPLIWGCSGVFIPTLTFVKHPSIWLETVTKFNGTTTFAPNFAYAIAVRRTNEKKLAKLDLSSLRIVGCGAEPNHPETLEKFVKHFASAGLKPEAMLPVYGMAEATLAMSFSRLQDPIRVDKVDGQLYADEGRAVAVAHAPGSKLDSPSGQLDYVTCGWALDGHTVKICSEDGTVLPDRTLGEVVFDGPSIAAGYYKNPKATAEVFKPWGLRTGDLGYTVGGELYVTGRKKDIIILNGRNYDPQTIEWVVAELDGIRKGNVIAFSTLGEQSEDLIVVAECRPGVDEESLKQQAKDTVRSELFLNVEDVVLLAPGGLSKTSSGKLQRSKTRQRYIDRTITTGGSRAMGSRGETITVARHMVRSLMSRVKYTVKERAVSIPVVGRIQNSITKRIRPRA